MVYGIFTIMGNVFSDLGFSETEAADLKVKAELTLQIYRRIKALGLTQVKAASQLGASQPDISKLMNGRHAGYFRGPASGAA